MANLLASPPGLIRCQPSDLELPAIAEFSGYHKLQEKFSGQHYSIQWTGWDVFKELKATGDQCSQGVCFNKQQDFSDSWRYARASYYLSPAWTLRSGIALDQKVANNVISIPDTQRLWYSRALHTSQPQPGALILRWPIWMARR